MLYSTNTASLILGALCNNPSLMLGEKYNFCKEDFSPVALHKIVFVCINNIAKKGAKKIDEIAINEYLDSYQAQKELFEDNNGLDYIRLIISLAMEETFDFYYDKLKKYSVLRDYKKLKFDISEVYDETKDEDEEKAKLEGYSLQDIIDLFDGKQSNIRKKYIHNANIETMIGGTDFDTLLDKLQEEPMIGAGMVSQITNSLYRGWCRGHLNLRGAPSSFGKTCIGIADQCNVSMQKMWDREQGKFIENQCYKGKGAYIHTEQKSETEIQTRFASTIAKVPYHKILDGLYNDEEKKRLSKAGKYMLESEIKIINYPNFTATGLRELIGDLAREGYEYITFDYIWNNSYIISDLKKEMGITNVTEVAALLHLSNSLKMIAEDYNVGVATMMQLNGKEKELEIVDESCLYGSRAVKTKLDNGAVYMYPRKKELAQVNELINQWNDVNMRDKDYVLIPNAVSHCFKCRYSRYGMNLKIWHYVDNGTGDVIDLFATTPDNEYIDVPHLIIN